MREREVDLVVHRLAPSFMDPQKLMRVTCLQMSDTGLWVNWSNWERPPPMNPRHETLGVEETVELNEWGGPGENWGADILGRMPPGWNANIDSRVQNARGVKAIVDREAQRNAGVLRQTWVSPSLRSSVGASGHDWGEGEQTEEAKTAEKCKVGKDEKRWELAFVDGLVDRRILENGEMGPGVVGTSDEMRVNLETSYDDFDEEDPFESEVFHVRFVPV